jgi:HPt (histidine-containing phosphotransfer) domain-containing protein
MEECAAFAWTDGGILASADELAGVEIPAGWTRLRKPFDLGELLDAVRTGANLRSEAGEEERVLLRLKAEFVATFPAKISELERLLRLEDADERRMAFGSLGHKLSGAAGLYQFQNLYQAAVALEETGSDRAARTVIEFLKQP